MIEGPSMAIATKGCESVRWDNDEMIFRTGTVFFVGAGTVLELSTGDDEGREVYRAFVKVN
jgi:hypothetical protein